MRILFFSEFGNRHNIIVNYIIIRICCILYDVCKVMRYYYYITYYNVINIVIIIHYDIFLYSHSNDDVIFLYTYNVHINNIIIPS